ncbi:hypothetical protein [Paractinoplanes maris]|uniref:hypothetical protein n=1 Tax=Paractinoplanes maris TaxID=1734446 RepID=UPI002021578A|nr:hypothetical protein [Actinoplanes maris]
MTLEPEGPELRRIHDDRVRFYLDNYKAIETWARIRSDANKELHELSLSMVDTIAQDVLARGDTGIDVRADDLTNPRKPRVVLARRTWRPSDGEGEAPAAIVIEWHNPPIDKRGEFTMYVGVRVGDRDRRDKRVAKYLSERAPRLREALGHPWLAESESFPVWRWVLQEGDALDELAILETARESAWRCWDTCAAVIDDVLRVA